MSATTLNFSEVQGGYESDWFKPNGAFQLDLQFAEKEGKNPIKIYSANDNNGTKPYALAGLFDAANCQHLNFPVTKVIPNAGVYYKIAAKFNPIAASYLVAEE